MDTKHTHEPWIWDDDRPDYNDPATWATGVPAMGQSATGILAAAPEYHEHAYTLAMLILQSEAYRADADVREQVDAVLAIHRKAEGR